MKRFTEIVSEAPKKEKAIVVGVGRFNPPTIGHELLCKKVMDAASARSAEHAIFVSTSKDPKKNPLDVKTKLDYLKKFFPKVNFKEMGVYKSPDTGKNIGGPFGVLQMLSDKGYKKVYIVTGADHMEVYKGAKKYINNDPNDKTGYKFTEYEVINAGDRDPDAEGVTGMSASKMRKAVFDGDYNEFLKGIPAHVSKTDAKKLYMAVRKGLQLTEEWLWEEKSSDVTILCLTSAEGSIEGSSIEKMEKSCKKKGIEFHVVKMKFAMIDPATATANKVVIQNINGDKKSITIDPTKTLCFVRGGVMNSEIGIGLSTVLQNNGVFMVNEKGAMDLCANKLQTALALKKFDLPHPRTAFVSDVNSIPNAMKAIGGKYPVILKTITGAEGIGVSIIESEKSLLSVLQSLWKFGAEVIIQEFLPGFKNDVRSIVLNGKIFACAKRDKAKGDFRTNIARGSKGGSFKLSEEEIALVEKVARVSKCYYVGVDHVVVDGKPYIIEMNASPGSGNVYTIYKDGKPVKEVDGQGLMDELIDHVSSKANWKLFTAVAVADKIVVDGNDFICKVDTGNSGYNSIHATDIKINEKNHTVSFKFNGEKQMTKNITSRVKIRRGGIKDQEVRPVVLMDVEFGGRKHKNVKFTLADRSHMTYKVLVGVRFLVQAGVQVDPSDMSAAASPAAFKKEEVDQLLDESVKIQPKKYYAVFDSYQKVIHGPYDSEKEAYYDMRGDVTDILSGEELSKRLKAGKYKAFRMSITEAEYKTKTGKTKASPKDKETGLPKKYVSGLSDTQAKKREKQFAARKDRPDSDPKAWKKLPGDPEKTAKRSKYSVAFAKKFGGKSEAYEIQNVLETLLMVDEAESLATKVEKARAFQVKATCKEEVEAWELYINDVKESMYELAIPEGELTLEEKFEDALVNHTGNHSEARITYLEALEVGTDKIRKTYAKDTPGQKLSEEDKEKEEQDAVYKEWSKLVNMGPKELENFIDSDEGGEAGLSRKEAGKAGSGGKKITSGRDSARAIVRMLKRKKTDWTANDWKWAKKQINFINRMKGAKGKMREPDGTPTRKLLALKIWGHNPEK